MARTMANNEPVDVHPQVTGDATLRLSLPQDAPSALDDPVSAERPTDVR